MRGNRESGNLSPTFHCHEHPFERVDWLWHTLSDPLWARQYRCSPKLPYRIPIHGNILSGHRLPQGDHGHGVHSHRTSLLRYHWIRSDIISDDMVIRSRSRSSIFRLSKQGKYTLVRNLFWHKRADGSCQLEPRTSIPLYAVTVTTTIACLLALINLGSSTVLNDVLSLSIAGFYATYFTASGLLLWSRCTGAIQSPTPGSFSTTAVDPRSGEFQLVWGPWRLPGLLGIVNNVFACAYMLVIWFFSFWPPTNPTSPSTMNYASLVAGSVVLFSIIYYFVWGRRYYMGPIVDVGDDR